MSFNPHITTEELNALACSLGLRIQHDCGGYRVAHPHGGYVFPNSGVCPTVARLACYIFLLGVDFERRQQLKLKTA